VVGGGWEAADAARAAAVKAAVDKEADEDIAGKLNDYDTARAEQRLLAAAYQDKLKLYDATLLAKEAAVGR